MANSKMPPNPPKFFDLTPRTPGPTTWVLHGGGLPVRPDTNPRPPPPTPPTPSGPPNPY